MDAAEILAGMDRINRGHGTGAEQQKHGVTPPKAIDNAIVNYVRLTASTGV